MPPRVVDVNRAGTGIGSWYGSLPPITRFYATAILAATVAEKLGFISAYWLALLWPKVYTNFEVWRIITSFFCMGPFSINWIFEMIWLLTYGGRLESQTFQFDPAECLLMYLFGGGSVLAVSLLCEVLGVGIKFVFNAGSIIFMLLYVWSRNFPESQVSIYGLFTVMAFHVPFVFVGIQFMLGGIPWSSILGVVVGHLYFYLTVLYPAIGGPRLLRPPLFLRNWLADRGVGTRVNTHAATAQDGFRAFRGRGMRLGAQ